MTPWSAPAMIAAACVIQTTKDHGPAMAILALAGILAEAEAIEREGGMACPRSTPAS